MKVRYRVDHDGYPAGTVRDVDDATGCRLHGETAVDIVAREVSTGPAMHLAETPAAKVLRRKQEKRNNGPE